MKNAKSSNTRNGRLVLDQKLTNEIDLFLKKNNASIASSYLYVKEINKEFENSNLTDEDRLKAISLLKKMIKEGTNDVKQMKKYIRILAPDKLENPLGKDKERQ